MVEAARREAGGPNLFDPGVVLATVRELQPSKGRGSIFVFERGQTLAGYCILVSCWSTDQCGTVLVADELYVSPGHRDRGLAEDFLLLLATVAPEGSTSIRIELPRGRRHAAPYAAIGFKESGRDTLWLRIPRVEDRGARTR